MADKPSTNPKSTKKTDEPAKKAVSWQGWLHEGTMPEHIRRPDGTLIDCEIWGITAAGWRERWLRDDS